MNTQDKKTKAGRIRYVFVIALICGMVWSISSGIHPEVELDERGWHVIWEGSLAQAAEADPGAGSSGILEVFIANHSASPADCYDENDSSVIEGWCTANNLGYCNADDSDIEIAYSTDFDIVVRVRGEADHCKRDGTWFDSDLKVEITSADLSIDADTTATGVVTANESGYEFLYVNFYVNEDNGASNLNIAKDETAEITSIKFSAYY